MRTIDASALEQTRRPILFLDFDVLCLNNPFGGYDAALALTVAKMTVGQSLEDHRELWSKLFDVNATRRLAEVCEEFFPWFVLSTSWWWIFSREAIDEVLKNCGLGFIIENLHPDWSTPKGLRPDIRWTESKNWLNAHPEYSDSWVILDDELSGTGLSSMPAELSPFVILCEPNEGLTQIEAERLRRAFRLRLRQRIRRDVP